MIDENRSLSIADWKLVAPHFEDFLKYKFGETYDDFLESIYSALVRIFFDIETNSQLRQSDIENRITIDIVSQFKMIGFPAVHDGMTGGHSDISISNGKYSWIAEAKFDDGGTYIMGGFHQLISRYTTGRPDSNGSALIIYSRKKSAKNTMDRWKRHFKNADISSNGYGKQALYPCQIDKELCFYSEITHPKSGLRFKTRHMPLSLFCSPQD